MQTQTQTQTQKQMQARTQKHNFIPHDANRQSKEAACSHEEL